MGSTAARLALAAGLGVLLVAGLSAALGWSDLPTVSGLGLLVTAGAASVGFASRGTDRRRALAGAGLALLPACVLAVRLAA